MQFANGNLQLSNFWAFEIRKMSRRRLNEFPVSETHIIPNITLTLDHILRIIPTQ
jgi:hypothetical protein